MKVLIKNAKIVDENSSFHQKSKDIYIENGTIVQIKDAIDQPHDVLIKQENLHVSLGWADFKTFTGDPGFEHKETIDSTLKISASGGFTQIGALPSNQPVTDSKAQVEYQKQKSKNDTVTLHSIGAISKGMRGQELSEMFDMYQSGCVLFSDDNNYLNTGLMHRALLYAKNFGGNVILNLIEPHLSIGQVNEGIASTRTGIKADASVGELIQLKKILLLVDYLDCSVHITGVSCKESVDMISEAKNRGLKITCDVNAMNLLFNEEDVLDFNTLMKVKPVLRSKKDQSALKEGIRSGVIDCIASDHRPVNEEDKNLEFDGASYGCYQLQSLFSSLVSKSDLGIEHIVRVLGHNNRKVLLNQEGKIEENTIADLTLFSPTVSTYYPQLNFLGKKSPNPFLEQTLMGKVIGIVNNNSVFLNE